MAVSRKALTLAVDARLKTVPNLRVYLRGAGLRASGATETVPTVDDLSGRVAPHAIQHPEPGTPADARLDGSRASLTWNTHIVLVVGRQDEMDRVVELVTGVLDEWRPDIPDTPVIGRLRMPDDVTGITTKRESDESPPRFSLTLPYRLHT